MKRRPVIAGLAALALGWIGRRGPVSADAAEIAGRDWAAAAADYRAGRVVLWKGWIMSEREAVGLPRD